MIDMTEWVSGGTRSELSVVDDNNDDDDFGTGRRHSLLRPYAPPVDVRTGWLSISMYVCSEVSIIPRSEQCSAEAPVASKALTDRPRAPIPPPPHSSNRSPRLQG